MGITSAQQYIDAETIRLNSKQTSVDSAYSAQIRNATLNESYRKRYAKYLEMLSILILALVAYLGMSFLQQKFPIIPQLAVDSLTMIVLALVLIYLIFSFIELGSRSNMNYDELDMPPMDASGAVAGSSALAAATGQLIVPSGACVGAECCLGTIPASTGTGPSAPYWDAGNSKCSVAFTTIEQAYDYKQIAPPMSADMPVPKYSGNGASGSSMSAAPVVASTHLSFSNV